jgi:hypothetical protein
MGMEAIATARVITSCKSAEYALVPANMLVELVEPLEAVEPVDPLVPVDPVEPVEPLEPE